MNNIFDLNTTNLTSNTGLDYGLIQRYIPSYVREGSWQPWDPADGEPCPAGFTCAVIGDSSLGAFSCDESEWYVVDVDVFCCRVDVNGFVPTGCVC